MSRSLWLVPLLGAVVALIYFVALPKLNECGIESYWVDLDANPGRGTAFFITETMLVTTYHTVEDNSGWPRVEIEADGHSCEVEVIWQFPSMDVAYLQLLNGKGTPAILGNSDNIPKGTRVVAFGNPDPELSHGYAEGVIWDRADLPPEWLIEKDEWLLSTVDTMRGFSGGPWEARRDGQYPVVGMTLGRLLVPSGRQVAHAVPINWIVDHMPSGDQAIQHVSPTSTPYPTPVLQRAPTAMPIGICSYLYVSMGDALTAGMSDTEIVEILVKASGMSYQEVANLLVACREEWDRIGQ